MVVIISSKRKTNDAFFFRCASRRLEKRKTACMSTYLIIIILICFMFVANRYVQITCVSSAHAREHHTTERYLRENNTRETYTSDVQLEFFYSRKNSVHRLRQIPETFTWIGNGVIHSSIQLFISRSSISIIHEDKRRKKLMSHETFSLPPCCLCRHVFNFGVIAVVVHCATEIIPGLIELARLPGPAPPGTRGRTCSMVGDPTELNSTGTTVQ